MTNINLELYRFFCEVATCKSMSKAADNLFVSQSAVSQAIMQLEQRLGGRLFDRVARGVTLTPEGKVMFSHVKNALSLIGNAQDKLVSLRKLGEGEIKIGASDTICSLYLLSRLKRFNEAHPNIHISVTNRVTRDTIELLKSGAVDVSFINLPIDDDAALDITPVMSVHDCFVVGERYAFLADRVLSLSELRNHPVLMLERASNSRVQLDRELTLRNLTISPAIELGSLSLLADFARIGLGVAATVREDVEGLLATGELRELRFEEALPARHIGLARLKNVTLSAAAQSFVSELE